MDIKLKELAEQKGFKSVIVAEQVQDDCDLMSDYFATKQVGTGMILGFSKHNRDLFSEMRQAAGTWTETAHLGVGKDVYRANIIMLTDVPENGYYKGQSSRWHGDLISYDEQRGSKFSTEAEAQAFIQSKNEPYPINFGNTMVEFKWEITKESIEHREKYSMGHGYYLKASGRYSSGWEVSKSYLEGAQKLFDANRLTDHAREQLGLLVRKTMAEQIENDPFMQTDDPIAERAETQAGTYWKRNSDHEGVEVRFADKPDDAVRATLKQGGFRWHRTKQMWYAKESPRTLAVAQSLVPQANQV